MANDQPKRSRGRPTLDPVDRKTGSLKFRLRGGLRERLAQAAEHNGRSLSEEVEFRLIDSFGPNDAMKAAIRELLDERFHTATIDIVMDGAPMRRAIYKLPTAIKSN